MVSYYTDEALDTFLLQEHTRRIEFEGPIDAPLITIETPECNYKIRDNGRIWEKNNPCTVCDDSMCLQYLKELSCNTKLDTVLCAHPLNIELLRMLCNWRKHVKETFLITCEPGSNKYIKTSICTSELTFLGRKTRLGGIIGIVSLTQKHIN